jgi:hypothetical protein
VEHQGPQGLYCILVLPGLRQPLDNYHLPPPPLLSDPSKTSSSLFRQKKTKKSFFILNISLLINRENCAHHTKKKVLYFYAMLIAFKGFPNLHAKNAQTFPYTVLHMIQISNPFSQCSASTQQPPGLRRTQSTLPRAPSYEIKEVI